MGARETARGVMCVTCLTYPLDSYGSPIQPRHWFRFPFVRLEKPVRQHTRMDDPAS
jgi:hypothetical protein